MFRFYCFKSLYPARLLGFGGFKRGCSLVYLLSHAKVEMLLSVGRVEVCLRFFDKHISFTSIL